VHIVAFIIRKSVTIHGHMNVKKKYITSFKTLTCFPFHAGLL